MSSGIDCVLFDLDGTLIDTAPDFDRVVNTLLKENNCPPVSEQQIRQTVSDGARALVKMSFQISESSPGFDQLNQRLLDLYEQELANTRARLYPGLESMLNRFDEKGIKWGIVTNKPERYTTLLLEQLQLAQRCGSVICPDHVENRKPHPEPILLACQQLQSGTERTVYVGDHLRDIQAAKNADVIAVAAAYGYLSPDARPEDWYADFIVHQSTQLEPLLNQLVFA